MAKKDSIFVCSECGAEFTRWFGKCPKCGEFSSINEVEKASAQSEGVGLKTSGALKPAKAASSLSEIGTNPIKRTSTDIGELDRVIGGGLVDAQVILFAGAPGSGKSTLSLRVADNLAKRGIPVLYSSGEESKEQIALRASRMGITNENIKITNESSLEVLQGHIDEIQPKFMIVDSLQTLASENITGSVGSISQSKEAAHVLTRIAKARGISMILVSQVVKSGDYAGSESILHIVDTGLMLESDSESPLKFLRAMKNRFGALDEVGCFQHSETGLEEVSDPGEVFLDTGEGDLVQGAACGFMSEGIRQIPIETQALAVTSTLANPRKQFNGVNFQRGQIVCAILDKHCNAKTAIHDVFVSTVAGVRVNDPLADLSMAVAILSSVREKRIPKKTVFVGEMSLTGFVRGSHMIETKVKEAERLGFETIVIPKNAKARLTGRYSIKIETIAHIKELQNFLV